MSNGAKLDRGSPTGAHRYPPRIAAPDSWRSLRNARVPPVDSVDDPLCRRAAQPPTLGGQLFVPPGGQFRMSFDIKQPTLPGGPEIGRCVHQLQMSPSLPFRNVMAVGGEVEKRPPGLVVGLPATWSQSAPNLVRTLPRGAMNRQLPRSGWSRAVVFKHDAAARAPVANATEAIHQWPLSISVGSY